LFGLYLGDGSLSSHARGVYRLRITLDTAYPGIIAAATDAARVIKGGHVVATSVRTKLRGRLVVLEGVAVPAASAWRRPQARPRDQAHRLAARARRALGGGTPARPDPLRRPSLREHRPGHLDLSAVRVPPGLRRHPGDLTPACDRIGVRWTRAGQTIYVSRKADVAALDGFIGPKR
jgi:hypothetical protein